MTDPYADVRFRDVPQTRQADPRQSPNNAGGWAFTVGWQQQLTRFLVLGTWGGTYYAGERDHTEQAVAALQKTIAEHPTEAVALIVEVSVAGRAPKQQPALFALALATAADDEATRRAAYLAVPKVCRTASHLFTFVKYARQFRGWGKGFQRSIARWYLDQPIADLAYQMVKYPSRDGWSHRDLLRMTHPQVESVRSALFGWAVSGEWHESPDARPSLIVGREVALAATTPRQVAHAIEEYLLPWEAVPSQWLNERAVWSALLTGLPIGATLRQLPRLTRLGLLDDPETLTIVARRLTSPERLARGRIHPLTILNALMAYRSGMARSGGEFEPKVAIIDALDAAFYASFGAVEPVGRPVRLALDVSASMAWGSIAGTALTPRVASAALALITAATEPDYEIVAFCHEMVPLTISPRQRLDDVVRQVSNLAFGGTDCSLPMVDAMVKQRPVDLFVTITDNETWAGGAHPHIALQRYRDRMARPTARCAVVGMTATEFSIAPPDEPLMMDVVGFDLATPNLISAFGRGEL